MIVLDKEFELYITAEKIQHHIKKLSKQIQKDYRDRTPTFLIILKGAFMFAADLLKNYDGDCKVSFMRISSYKGLESSGEFQLHLEADGIENEDVIIIEDIVDTGNSLEYIFKYLEDKNIRSRRLVSLFHKPEAYKKSYSIDYIGMKIPNKFILGYGLDYNGFGRNLPDVYQLKIT